MAQITLKIQVNENAGTSLNFNTASKINNVSSSLSEKTTKNDGVNGISFATGSISLANGYVGNDGQFQSEKDKYNGYMFGATDDNGYYSLKLTVSGDNLDKIVIHFDKNANQFATEAIIDNNKTIYSDDPVWAIDFGAEASTHTVEFTKWNRPNYNACFTLIQIMLEYFELNKNWIDNLESLSQTTTNAENIEYGMLASSGSVDVLDNEGYIADLITDGLLDPSNIPVELYINNTLIQKHITTSSTYDTDGTTLSINFSNTIDNFSKLKYKGYNYPNESKTAYEMLYDVLNDYYNGNLSVESFNEMLSENIVYGQYNYYGPIHTYLKNIIIGYPFIKSGQTYTQVINEFCSLAQLQAFLTNDGNLKFVSARPIVPHFSDGIDYIFMPPDSVSTNFQQDLILKNNYGGVELSYTNVTDTIDTGSPVYTWRSKDGYTSYTKSDSKTGSIVTLGVKANTGAKVEAEYYTATVSFPKKSATNLEQTLSVLDGKDSSNIPNIKYSVNYTERKGTAKLPTTMIGGMEIIPVPNYTETLTKYGPIVEYNASQSKYDDISVSTGSSFDNLTASVKNEMNLDGIKITEDPNNPNNYIFTFTILVGFTKFSYVYQPSLEKVLYGYSQSISPTSVELTVYGNKRVISFNDSQLKTSENTSNIADLGGGGNLIQDETTCLGSKILDIITNNVLSDYKNGIKTAKTTINGINLYDQNENLVKDWNKGEIINNGDILGFSNKRNKNGSMIYWKNVGRKFLYDGEPLTEIEIMECKPVELYTDSGQFWDMNYSTFQKSIRELSSQKSIVVSNDYTSLSAGENVSSLEGFLAVPKTVTSLTGDFSSATGFAGMKFEIPNEISIKVPSTIFYFDVDIDKWAEKSFDSALLRGNTYFSKNGQAINNLEINSKYIGDYAFCNYAGTNVTLGDSVGSIGMYSFKNSKITSIIIPNSVKTIFREAFNNCYNLSSLKLGNAITELGYGSFVYCSSLTEITIPASVTYINRMSFYGCSSLTKITFENPNGWKSTQTGASIDLSDPAKNVTLLTQTYAEQNIAIF